MKLLLLFLLSSPALAKTVLITGSNRGLGLEFARQFAEKGWTVYATHRRKEVPETLKTLTRKFKNVIPERMDVGDSAQVRKLARKLKGKPIDVLLNNAAIFYKEELVVKNGVIQMDKAQAFGTLDFEFFDEMMNINAKGPLRVSEAFYENVRMSSDKKIIALTAGMGMLGRPPFPPGLYHYPASKTLLNKLMTILADEAKKDGVLVGILDPGGVKVERIEALGIPTENMLGTEEAIRKLISVIESLTPEKSGKNILYTGEIQPW